MSAPDLADLVARVEGGERSDQYALLTEAFETIKGPIQTRTRGGTVRFHADWFAFERMLKCNAFESAALTLVPEGWTYVVANCSAVLGVDGPQQGGGSAYVCPVPGDASGNPVTCATPALALVAAALTARQQENNDVV